MSYVRKQLVLAESASAERGDGRRLKISALRRTEQSAGSHAFRPCLFGQLRAKVHELLDSKGRTASE